ncbi:peroxiredoxin (plasmid) [Burkholderia sp. THE68]|uniref:organic hydroperoxide resistance protein n=1 Tax=Burkholderiaceae TaxID=119060 RepID=UPI001318025D|nr:MULTISPECIES: organic hydroperoxide resistance protein [Burkholderiaceae]BBU32030.1 peroxiredoxin [Burkholderia sp. THE68]BCQ27476.1 Ohr family peroxiredoxin [Caballeronia sp. NK8]
MTQIDTVLYTGKTRVVGGREGFAKSTDGRLDVKLSPPGSTGAGTNPEQMLAAGWSACFIGAMGKAAAKLKTRLPAETAVDAEVDLGMAGEAYLLRARLNVSLPGIERAVAEEIANLAHQTCPYSKALKSNIDVTITVV